MNGDVLSHHAVREITENYPCDERDRHELKISADQNLKTNWKWQENCGYDGITQRDREMYRMLSMQI